MSSFGKWLQKQIQSTKKTNHHEQPHNQQQQKCSCTACGSHMHCSVGPSRTQPIGVDPSRIQLSDVDPSRIQRCEIPCTQSVAAKNSPFSSSIKSLRRTCWVNLEPQTWLFSQLSSSNQNFTLDGSATLARVRPRPAHSLRCSFTGPQPYHSRSLHSFLIGLIRRSYETHSFHCVVMLLQQGTMHS